MLCSWKIENIGGCLNRKREELNQFGNTMRQTILGSRRLKPSLEHDRSNQNTVHDETVGLVHKGITLLKQLSGCLEVQDPPIGSDLNFS